MRWFSLALPTDQACALVRARRTWAKLIWIKVVPYASGQTFRGMGDLMPLFRRRPQAQLSSRQP